MFAPPEAIGPTGARGPQHRRIPTIIALRLPAVSIVIALAASACALGDPAAPPATEPPTPPPTVTPIPPTARPTEAPTQAVEGIPAGAVRATVTRIVDAETFYAWIDEGGSREIKVGYIGLDAPGGSRDQREPFSAEALEANAALLSGGAVFLLKDVSEVDVSGRLLRYVFLPDGTFVNGELVARGFAVAAPSAPDIRYADLLQELQSEASQERRGLWGLATATPAASPTPWWIASPTGSPTPIPTRRPGSLTPIATTNPTATPIKGGSWSTGIGGGAHGVTGQLTLEGRRTAFRVGESIWFVMNLNNTTAALIPYGVLGVAAVDLDPSDGNGGTFHTSWNGQATSAGTIFINPGPFRHRDYLRIATPGQYTLRVSMCFSTFGDCLNGGAWEDLSPDLVVTVQ